MSRAAWVVRPARKSKKDQALLASFDCADHAVDWQVEVESFVRTSLFAWAFDAFREPPGPASAVGI